MPLDVTQPQVFRSSFWRGVALIWLPVLAFTVWDVARRSFPPAGVTALAVMAAITVLVYAVGWRPAVVAGQQAVIVRNPFRTSTIPWGDVTDIDVTDALRIHTRSRVIRAWAVDRGGAASNMLRGMGSKRVAVDTGVDRSTIEAMARRSPAEYTVATLVDVWRQRRDQARGVAHTVWEWPVLGAFLVTVAVAAVRLAT